MFDDGGGPALYAGGNFTTAGGVAANRIAKWDGSSWSALGSGTERRSVYALTVFDDGGGPALYAGGDFTTAGGVAANRIAKWDGSSWAALGSGMSDNVHALTVFDDGGGPALYAGGFFTTAGGVTANRIAKWDGSSWAALGSGMSGAVFALTVFDDGSGLPALYAGGRLRERHRLGRQLPRQVGLSRSPRRARSTARPAPRPTAACPRSRARAARARAPGRASRSRSPSVEGQKSGLLFYGVTGAKATPWGAGTSYLCVEAPLKRMSTQNSGGTAGACDGVFAEDWNAYIAAHPAALGQPFAGGETVWAQGWFRDPPAPKSTNLSDALVFQLLP